LDKTNIVKPALEKSLEKEPNNQIIISRQGSQRKLLDAMTDFFEHLKLKIDNDQERALESFIYRNFAFEPDDDTDFTKRTVSNYGFKPIDFIPPKHAKDFTKLLLYLSDKEYLLSNKTNIIKTLDEEIHGSGSKRDGFSYSSLIRIPNKEHHLFPDNEIRRRVRSILRIDD
jgi:alpha-amylase/alpha-mannosidase (GH57 family)